PGCREGRLLGEYDRAGAPVADLDAVDRAVGEDRPAVVEEAAAQRVHERLVAADGHGGGVEEAERHREGTLPARQRRALQVQGDGADDRLPGLVRLEGEFKQLVRGHAGQVLDAAAEYIPADLQDLLELRSVRM